MSNSWLLVLIVAVDYGFVFLLARLHTQRLFGVLALNLILATVFASTTAVVVGYDINVGNIFYACVFIPTHFLLERIDRKKVYHTIVFGAGTVLIFGLLVVLAVRLLLGSSDGINAEQLLAFGPSIRLVIASVLAYMFAQYVNIRIYASMSQRTNGAYMWLRSAVAIILAQFVDSCIFFSIAFIDMPSSQLVWAIMIGWSMKSIIGMVGIPFLHFDRMILSLKKQ